MTQTGKNAVTGRTGKSYGSATVKKLEKSQAEITGSIPFEIWGKHRAQALKNINESVTVAGFRKGMIPENILVSKVGEMAILEEMAELALSPAYVEIVMDHKMDAIGRPNIQVTKLAKENPLEFKIITAVVPEVFLPDYKKLATEQVMKQNPDDVKLTSEELETTIMRIRKSATPHTKLSSDAFRGASKANHENIALRKESGDDKADETSLPELTDAFVQKLGAFSDVSDFKTKLRATLIQQKSEQAQEKLRIRIADAIIDASKIDLPDLLIQSETSRIEAQFMADIERMGVKLEDYLKHAKKSIEEIRAEWRPHAEKKAKLQLALNAIAQKENIKPTDEEIGREVKHILEHYKDADSEKAQAYAETVLTNERVFQLLEKNNTEK